MKVKKIIEHRHFTADALRRLCDEKDWPYHDVCARLIGILCDGSRVITNKRIYDAAFVVMRYARPETVDSIEHIMEQILRCAHITFEVVYEEAGDLCT